MDPKPTNVEELELWKLRAHFSERKAVLAELRLLQMRAEELTGEVEAYRNLLLTKYSCADITVDGEIVYEEE